MKLEALNHRGEKSDTPGQLSVEILCEQTGESKNQIFRLIRFYSPWYSNRRRKNRQNNPKQHKRILTAAHEKS